MAAFENYDFPANQFDLVNAQYSLPFNPAASSHEVRDGSFAGQFFGVRDEWNTESSTMTFYVGGSLTSPKKKKTGERREDEEALARLSRHWTKKGLDMVSALAGEHGAAGSSAGHSRP